MILWFDSIVLYNNQKSVYCLDIYLTILNCNFTTDHTYMVIWSCLNYIVGLFRATIKWTKITFDYILSHSNDQQWFLLSYSDIICKPFLEFNQFNQHTKLSEDKLPSKGLESFLLKQNRGGDHCGCWRPEIRDYWVRGGLPH